jgi:hypothetical protein
MPYSIEHLPDPPVVVFTFEGRIDFEKDVRDIVNWVIDHQDEVAGVIHNVAGLHISFSDAVVAMGAAFKPDPSRPDPDLDVIVVGLTGIMKGAAQWLSHPQYGAKRVYLYDTLEEALDAVRAKIARASQQAPG